MCNSSEASQSSRGHSLPQLPQAPPNPSGTDYEFSDDDDFQLLAMLEGIFPDEEEDTDENDVAAFFASVPINGSRKIDLQQRRRTRRLSRISEASCETAHTNRSMRTCISMWRSEFSDSSDDFGERLAIDASKITRGQLAEAFTKTASFESDLDVRLLVQLFVESAVRGFSVEVLSGTGQPSVVGFCLNREIDAFDLTSLQEGSPRHLDLLDVKETYLGDARWVQEELGQFQESLDASCAVLEFVSNQCLGFRFHGGIWAETGKEEAVSFVYCMQTFVGELQRQKTAREQFR